MHTLQPTRHTSAPCLQLVCGDAVRLDAHVSITMLAWLSSFFTVEKVAKTIMVALSLPVANADSSWSEVNLSLMDPRLRFATQLALACALRIC
jgi:hypothetical protein